MKLIRFSASWIVVLALVSLSPAATHSSGMTSQIISASPSQTVMSVEFDAAATLEHLNDAQVSDDYGTLLAIAGHGIPTGRVTRYELGSIVSGLPNLDEATVPSSMDELASVGEPAIWHDLRVVPVNFRPVMRDEAGDIRTVTSVEFELTTFGSGGVNEQDDPVSFSSAFYPLYRSMVDNLDDTYPVPTLRAPGRMLVIIPPGPYADLAANVPAWHNWIDLKTRKGYQVQVATLEDIRQAVGDSTLSGIRQYIQQVYFASSDRDLEYVILIGDASAPIRVPTQTVENPEHAGEYAVGDNYYYTVDGDDYIPDVLNGRMSVNTITEIANYLTKVYNYETFPYTTNPSWFSSALFTAGNYSDNGTYPSTPVWNMSWARWRMMRDGCITQGDTCYFHGPSDPPNPCPSLIVNRLNAGVSALFYRGWAASPGFQYPPFTTSDLTNVHTGSRNPAVFAIVCGSANFGYTGGQCLGEALTFMSSANNGAIGYYGASDIHTNTRHNNAILAGIVDAMMTGGIRSMGALAEAGEMEAYRQFPLERVPLPGDTISFVEYYVYHVFNMLGDPETQTYICQPSSFDLAYPGTINHGTALVPVTVTSSGSPVSGAFVTLRADSAGPVINTTTDANGQAWLTGDFSNASVAQLTVWKDTYFMRWVDIPVSSADFDPAITSINWQDGNDNLPNPGETTPFTLTVRNLGSSATDLSITVTSQDSRITVVNGSGTVGTLQPGESGTSTQMSIALGDGLTDGEHPRLSVQLSGNDNVTRMVDVPVAAPQAGIVSLTVNDGGNGILEPGESPTVTVTVRNIGSENAANLTATVYSWDNAVSFPDLNIGWGAVNIGQESASSDPFQVTLASGVTPGRQILLRYDIFNNGTFIGTTSSWLTTGVVTINAPTGPDAYGYYAYEDIDAGYAATPTYNWVELDPAYGGSGADGHTVHDDTFFGMVLPQPFYFYGQAYDSIWVCSNGWFSFSQPLFPEFRNWDLPMAMMPPQLVCPFWDDLIIEQFSPNQDSAWTIWTRYDTNPDRLTILWRAFNRAGLSGSGNPDPCIFEAALEYNGSNDGSILVQLNVVTQDDDWPDGNNPSNYSTIGIQNFDMRTGMTLTYANMYPASVDTLREHRAIRFTTTPPDNFLGADDPVEAQLPTQYALYDAYPNPFNPVTELRFDMPEAGRVLLAVYDVLGREQAVLVDDFRGAGSYHITFDGRHLPSGLYFARLEAGSFSQVKKLMLVK